MPAYPGQQMTPQANGQRDAIAAALMNIAQPPPQTMPQMQGGGIGGIPQMPMMPQGAPISDPQPAPTMPLSGGAPPMQQSPGMPPPVMPGSPQAPSPAQMPLQTPNGVQPEMMPQGMRQGM